MGDRDQVLHLHPGCDTCAWLAARFGQVHRLVGALKVARPSKFGPPNDLDDDGEAP